MPSKAGGRKVRIVCISDTHNTTPRLPKGDVLIHAGDLTNQGTPAEIERQIAWLQRQEFQAKVVVAGNHDLALDAEFYEAHGARMHNQVENAIQRAAELRERMATSEGITYLCHEAACVRLEDGTAINVFGSPYSRRNGLWAFGYGDEQGDRVWARMAGQQTRLDVLVSHGPAQGICDADSHGQADGCSALLSALERGRPRLVVCGHRHEGRGSVEIAWGSLGSHALRSWQDPGREGGRLSLVDLTGRGRGGEDAWADDGRLTEERWAGSGSRLARKPGRAEDVVDWAGKSGLGRTCVVNAAIMAKSHGKVKQHNKPIVVDMELSSSL